MITNGKVVGPGISREVYAKQPDHVNRGDPGFIMSRGHLMEFATCPARWLAGVESDETKSTEWGSLIDCMVLTPEKFDERYAVCPAEYPRTPTNKDPSTSKPWNWNADYCKEWRDARAPLLPVKADQFEEAERAVKAVKADPEISALLLESGKQVMAVAEWQDQETGISVPLRILLDIAPHKNSRFGDSLADFKTCADATPRAWGRAVYEHGYHIQAAIYKDVWESATGEDRKYFLHAIQESFAPFQVGHRCLIDGGTMMDLGRRVYQDALRRYCQCLKTKVWPGFETDDGVNQLWNGWQEVAGELWMTK